jgi:hypothetical protein
VNLAAVKIVAMHNMSVYGVVGKRNETILREHDPAFLRYLLSQKTN